VVDDHIILLDYFPKASLPWLIEKRRVKAAVPLTVLFDHTILGSSLGILECFFERT
jgi:hypothetical protein